MLFIYHVCVYVLNDIGTYKKSTEHFIINHGILQKCLQRLHRIQHLRHFKDQQGPRGERGGGAMAFVVGGMLV